MHVIDVLEGLPWQPPPKFQHRYWIHLLLLVLTLVTTTWAGSDFYEGFRQSAGLVPERSWVAFLLGGLWFSLPVLTILGAHEFGHYFLCRIHDVDATLPYFLPAPPPLITGTLGAVIRIREHFPSKAALFDIGIAGPIGGFLMLLPFLFWGVHLSVVVPVMPSDSAIYFGEPLLYKAASWVSFGRIPEGYDVSIHPMAFAAWWGLLATALNLMPFGQLDGGHVIYSLIGRRARVLSIATLVAACVLVAFSLSWISMTVVMLIMAFTMGLNHPRVVDEDTPLDPRRRLMALLALLMFILCFTPVPIQTFFGK